MRRSRFSYIFSSLVAIMVGLALTIAITYGGKKLIAYIGGVPFEKLATKTQQFATSILSQQDQSYDDGQYEADAEEDGNATDLQTVAGADSNHNDVAMTAMAFAATDLSKGQTFISSTDDRSFPIASITKLITAAVAIDKMPDNRQIEITADMLRTYGSSGTLREGEKLRVNELLYPLLMVSSNDAAEALARGYGRKEFIKAMNEWTQSIGAYQTYFADPSGLSPDNISTVHDLTIITKAIHDKYPQIFDITGQKTETVRVHTWTNPTHFLNMSSYIGGKNGYTTEAGRTSIAIFNINKSPIAIVILKSKNRDKDILELLDFVVHSGT